MQRHQWAANSPNYDHGWRLLSATIYPDDEAIDLGTALRGSANMHLIPADSNVRRQLKHVRAGNVVHLRGYLVNARRADGFTWNSSLTRNDTGAGACELFYVASVQSR